MGLNEGKCINHAVQYLEAIYDFLEAYTNIEGANLRISRNIVALLGDIATFLPQNEGVKVKSTLPYVE